MTVRDRILVWLLAVVALVFCWAIVEAALMLRAWGDMPDRLMALTEEQLALLRRDAREEIARTRRELRHEIEITRAGLLGRVDAAGARIDARAAEIQQEVAAVMSRATETASTATSLLEDARPGVRAWSQLSPALAANTLGAIAAAKVTAGETAQTMRHVRSATPDLVQAIQASATASQQAAISAAQTSQNLAELTRPGPRWLRWVGIGASVLVPASQVALPAVVAGK